MNFRKLLKKFIIVLCVIVILITLMTNTVTYTLSGIANLEMGTHILADVIRSNFDIDEILKLKKLMLREYTGIDVSDNLMKAERFRHIEENESYKKINEYLSKMFSSYQWVNSAYLRAVSGDKLVYLGEYNPFDYQPGSIEVINDFDSLKELAPGEVVTSIGYNNIGLPSFLCSEGFYDEDGELQFIFTISFFKKLILKDILDFVGFILALIISVFFIFYFFVRRIMVKKITLPLEAVSKSMVNFVTLLGNNDNNSEFTDKIKSPSLYSITPSIKEIRLIVDSFVDMSLKIHSYLKDLKLIIAERERTLTQMNIARQIQYGMCKAEFYDKSANIDVSAFMQPAQEVGGDLYECCKLDDMKYFIAIGDVSGKGITAALFMAMVKSMLSAYIKHTLDPAKALNLINNELCAENPERIFVTLFAMIIDIETGEITFANAGHNPPARITRNGAEYIALKHGTALGFFKDVGIENEELKLSSGEGLLLYTDGITEAVNPDRIFFGEERLKNLLSSVKLNGSAETLNLIKDAVTKFYDGGEQFDDMTSVSVFYKPGLSGMTHYE